MAVMMYVYELQIPSGTYGTPICQVLLHCIRTFRTRFETQMFTNYESHLEHSENQQTDTPLHSNVSSRIRLTQTHSKEYHSYTFFDTIFDTTRTRFETQTFTSSVRSIYELCSNVHELRSNHTQIHIQNLKESHGPDYINSDIR